MIEQLTLFAERATWASEQRRRPRRQKCLRHSDDGRGRHDNSLEAHDRLAGALAGRRAEIAAWVELHGPATDREIVRGLYGEWADMNMVRPRVTELLESGHLAEAGKVRDETTGMMVRRVRAV